MWFFNLAIIVDFLTLCRATAAFFMLSLNIRDYNHSEIILYFSLLPSLLYTNAIVHCEMHLWHDYTLEVKHRKRNKENTLVEWSIFKWDSAERIFLISHFYERYSFWVDQFNVKSQLNWLNRGSHYRENKSYLNANIYKLKINATSFLYDMACLEWVVILNVYYIVYLLTPMAHQMWRRWDDTQLFSEKFTAGILTIHDWALSMT